MSPEPKVVMDAEGNWITVLIIRTRSGKGWVETLVAGPFDRADRKEAA